MNIDDANLYCWLALKHFTHASESLSLVLQQIVAFTAAARRESFAAAARSLALSRLSCHGASASSKNRVTTRSDGSVMVRLRPEGSTTSDNSEVLIAAAVDGCGILLAPHWMATKTIEAKDLVRVLPQRHGVSAGLIRGLLLPGRMQPAKTCFFLDYVTAALQGRLRLTLGSSS